MKKLSTILIAVFALGACLLSPLTPPPPALDLNNPADKAKVDDLLDIVFVEHAVDKDKLAEEGIVIEDDGTVRIDKDKIPADVIPPDFEGIIPIDENGDVVLDLHSIEVQPDGTQQIVYKMGDSYIAVVIDPETGFIDVKNTPTIDFGTINWDEKGIYDTTLTPPTTTP